MLSVSCARAFATFLVVSHTDAWAGVDGRRPDLADLSKKMSSETSEAKCQRLQHLVAQMQQERI